MLLLGIGLLIGAVALGGVAWRRARRPLPAPVAPEGLPGDIVEVRGTARAHGTTQVASLSETACVWHAHEVRRHYRPSAEAEPVWDRIADHASGTAFTVVQGGRAVLVAPGKAWPDGASEVLSRRIGPPKRGERSPDADLMRRVNGRISGVFRGETLAFEYLEWAVPEGASLRVRGHIGEHQGHPALLLTPTTPAPTSTAPPPEVDAPATPNAANAASTPGRTATPSGTAAPSGTPAPDGPAAAGAGVFEVQGDGPSRPFSPALGYALGGAGLTVAGMALVIAAL
ncbi:MAG: hypothetical protein GEV11_22435 [Streptosporangiales bacterium]|nr:hypothetical protein [Streptosporangiales bacterium]